jgi:hypothetical protein
VKARPLNDLTWRQVQAVRDRNFRETAFGLHRDVARWAAVYRRQQIAGAGFAPEVTSAKQLDAALERLRAWRNSEPSYRWRKTK